MWRETLDAFEVLDDPGATGEAVAALIRDRGGTDVEVMTLSDGEGSTDVVRATFPGRLGRDGREDPPTLGIIGTLGGVGARPEQVGFVSDGDGALVAVACALKAASMAGRGDVLSGDLIITTHVCPSAPTRPHDPVPFMMSPVELPVLMSHLVHERMGAILSVDTTRGNRVINHRGFAVSPPVNEGWILRVSEDLLEIMESVTGRAPVVLPITTQDITPYGNGVFHLNSIMQPATVTAAAVVGVAITAESAVAGSATGATRLSDAEEAARFCLEVAKAHGDGRCRFVDEAELRLLVETYGPMAHLQSEVRPVWWGKRSAGGQP